MKYFGIGVAGNFAGHLEQAGEASDFKDLKDRPVHKPKGVFPYHVPGREGFLGTDPISATQIRHPGAEFQLQIEPELALLCTLQYAESTDSTVVSHVTVNEARAFNDCSQRRPNAKKISEKKNWGPASKGFSDQAVAIKSISELGNYRIASYLMRNEQLIEYGINSRVADYMLFGQELLEWLQNCLNTQQDLGPLENVNQLLTEANRPETLVVSVGATRYTDFGATNYLQIDDESIVVIYDETQFEIAAIEARLKQGQSMEGAISILRQRIVRPDTN